MKRNIKFWLIYFSIIVLVLIIGFTYGFFSMTIEGNDSMSTNGITVKKNNLVLSGTTHESFSTIPGDSSSIQFTVTNNDSSIVNSYYLNFSNLGNNFNPASDVSYTLTCTSSSGTCDGISETVFPTEEGAFIEQTSIEPSVIHTYLLTITFNNTGEDQSSNNNKLIIFDISLDDIIVHEEYSLLSELIIKNNGGRDLFSDQASIDFANAAVNGDYGLKYTVDQDGSTFYFRGKMNDNYLEFAGNMWRIVRINGDGTIRLVLSTGAKKADDTFYTGTFNTHSDCSTSGNTNSITKAINCLKYNGGTYDSTNNAKIMLNEWYTDNMSGFEAFLALGKFCNDYSTNNIANSSNQVLFGPFYRLSENKNPSLTCTVPDGYTYTGSAAETIYLYIGLLSADELALAGAVYDTANYVYYLYQDYDTWTMSGHKWFKSVGRIFGVKTSASKSITGLAFDTTQATKIMPVINIKANAFGTGDGTRQNPYRITILG